MKPRMPVVFCLVSLPLLLSSLVGYAGDDETGVSRTCANDNWRYEIEITKPGTRSEGEWGHLYYGDWEVPRVVETIVIAETRYDFHPRRLLWEFGGFRRAEDFTPPEAPADAAPAVTEGELTRGWYEAPLNAQKRGTPACWVWVKVGAREAYVDPQALPAFLDRIDAPGPAPDMPKPPA